MSTRILAAVTLAAILAPAGPPAWASQEQGNRAYTMAQGIPEYRIGPEDKLRIRIWTGVEAREYEVVVQADGNIFLPFVGLASMRAGDRSALELRDEIVEQLRESYREPAAEVIVTEKLARLATILGEVRTTVRGETGPGRYPLPGRIRLVDFITEHGGLTDEADLNRAQVTRGDETILYSLSRAIFQNDESQNPILDAGDLIYIPALSTNSRKLLVFGEVARPGLLELTDDIPISEAIALVGGFTSDAHKSSVVVVRGGLENPVVLNSNWESLQRGDLTQDLTVQDGDMIFVGRRRLATFTDVMYAFALPLSTIYTTVLISNSAGNSN
ncbi:MAG TPA: SLBB domain-containing protein [Vicinamibacteria bacterium]